MSNQLHELVKRYQAGEDVRGEIEILFIEAEVTETLISDNVYLDGLDGDRQIYNNSLDYALSNYSPDKNMKFVNYFKMAYLSRLTNEYDKAKNKHKPGEMIPDKKAFLEATSGFKEKYKDDEIFKDCIYIGEKELDELSDGEYEYIKITKVLLDNNYDWGSDEAAAAVLGVNADTIRRRKHNIKEALNNKNEQRKKDHKAKEQERENQKPASLKNEFGIKDPTPWEAIRNIEKGNYQTK